MKATNSLKVLMVGTSYPLDEKDWRGRFIYNLVEALARRKDIGISLWAPPGKHPDNVQTATAQDDDHWLSRLSQRGGIAHLLRTRRLLAAGELLQLVIRLVRCYRTQQADLCHVNWLQNALPLWGTRTPALITVLGTDFGLLRLPGMIAMLRAILRQRRCILAPNAEWMTPRLESAFGDIAEIRTLPFGVDDAWFALERLPRDRIPQWLAVTRITRKKIGDLFDWGEGLFGTNRRLHLFGPMQEEIQLPYWVEYHGATHPEELLRIWFPQACGVISLSRHDEGSPQVLLEAMAAGLPVIASDLQAHSNMLRHLDNGWIAASAEELLQGLEWLEVPMHNFEIGEAARTWVKMTMGTWNDCADRYASAYGRLVEPAP